MERTIWKLADQSQSIRLPKSPDAVMLTGRIEAKQSVRSSLEISERGNAGHPQSTRSLPRSLWRSGRAGSRFRQSPRSSSFPRRSQGYGLPKLDRLAAPGSSPAWPKPPRAGNAKGSYAPRSHWCGVPGTPPTDDEQDVSGLAKSLSLCSRRHVRQEIHPLSRRPERSR
jgi:hypothetical protein